MISSVIHSNKLSQTVNSLILSRSFSKLNIDFSSSTKINDTNENALQNLRHKAKQIAKEFPINGLQGFFERWGDHIYDHGMKITDPNELDKFTTSVREDINDIHNHVDDWSHKEVIHLSNSSKEYIE